ncbi:MAG TPA: DnaJ domain-containing protein [Marmoricola sp.]|nr:DnaJ domain-containing protein [Marmoricola sp.]
MSSPQPDDPYATLGLSSDATDAQINKAWRRKTRSMGPSDPEFATINDAAALLLDPERRSAYDADRAEIGASPKSAMKPKRSLAGWNGTIVFAGVMAIIAVGLAIWQGINYANRSDNGGSGQGTSANAFAAPSSAQTAALSAAQQALPVVLSYDYRSMDAGIANANRFLSAAQQQKFAITMQRIINGGTVPGTTEKLAPVAQRQAVVTTTVISAGIISATAKSAQVGAFIKQVTAQKSGTTTHQNWVQVGMINVGGSWLIDGICVPSAGMTCTATGK